MILSLFWPDAAGSVGQHPSENLALTHKPHLSGEKEGLSCPSINDMDELLLRGVAKDFLLLSVHTEQID